jgi:hypothetical protein
MSHAHARMSTALAAAVALTLGACCSDCIKPPPCGPCEDPCCLTPVQKVAYEKKTRALPAPALYVHGENTYLIFTEKGKKDFEKDPSSFEEKGALRLIRGGQTWRGVVDPRAEVD